MRYNDQIGLYVIFQENQHIQADLLFERDRRRPLFLAVVYGVCSLFCGRQKHQRRK